MSFLGVVILSFGFRIFGQRRLMRRHAPEIFGATFVSAAFSLFATALAARSLGLRSGAITQTRAACPYTMQGANCRQRVRI
jgi:putative effector of murein hydrolase